MYPLIAAPVATTLAICGEETVDAVKVELGLFSSICQNLESLRRAVAASLSKASNCPLCQTSCRLNRIGTFGGTDISKWHNTDRDTKIG
jgi:hypothetical protein